MEDMVQRMPIHDMAQWVPTLDNVFLFFEDPRKKLLVGLVCLVKQLDDALALIMLKKRFKVKDVQDLDVVVVLEKWIKFKELIVLEREDTTRDSQGGCQHITTMVENSTTKWPQKDEIKAAKKNIY